MKKGQQNITIHYSVDTALTIDGIFKGLVWVMLSLTFFLQIMG